MRLASEWPSQQRVSNEPGTPELGSWGSLEKRCPTDGGTQGPQVQRLRRMARLLVVALIVGAISLFIITRVKGNKT